MTQSREDASLEEEFESTFLVIRRSAIIALCSTLLILIDQSPEIIAGVFSVVVVAILCSAIAYGKYVLSIFHKRK